MSNNDFFTVAYKILSYLKKCYEDGVNPDPNILQTTTFSISNGQFYKILKMLANDSYIDEITFTTDKTGGGRWWAK